MGAIFVQSWPAGQHSTALIDAVVFSARHVVDCGHVKSLGNAVPQEMPASRLFTAVVSSRSSSAGTQIAREETGPRRQAVTARATQSMLKESR